MHAAVVLSEEWKWKRKAFEEQVDALEVGGKSRPKRCAQALLH
jgi:hypothetical protein